jgi:hypothetical protein
LSDQFSQTSHDTEQLAHAMLDAAARHRAMASREKMIGTSYL